MDLKRGEQSREVAWASLLSVKAVSASGVPVRGKGGTLCQVGRGVLLEIPALCSAAKNSSQFCALAMGETRGYGGGIRDTLPPHTQQEQRQRRKEGAKAGIRSGSISGS